jgi:hypothetical protein
VAALLPEELRLVWYWNVRPWLRMLPSDDVAQGQVKFRWCMLNKIIAVEKILVHRGYPPEDHARHRCTIP